VRGPGRGVVPTVCAALHAPAARAGAPPGGCGASLVSASDGRTGRVASLFLGHELRRGLPGVAAEAWEFWRAEVTFADRFINAAPDLDIVGNDAWRGTVSLRWVLIHMVEEYARHNGHADLLRERIDGAIGL
jgi:hypothetical protein